MIEINQWNGMLTISLALSTLSLLLISYLIYKVRQIHVTLYGADLEVRKVSLEVTRNLQQMEQLSHELALERPLPTMRGWAASPDVLLLLARRVRSAGPKTIVECGSGVSTIVQAQAARLNGYGHVHAIDHDADFAEMTRQALEDFGLSKWATVTHAPLKRSVINGAEWEWYDLQALPNLTSIDLLFVDGPPADVPKPLSRYPAGPVLFPRLSAGGSVFLDDSARPGEIEVLRRWNQEFASFDQVGHYCEKGCSELRPTQAVLSDRSSAARASRHPLAVDTSAPVSP